MVEQNNAAKSRQPGLDFIRVIASFSVVAVHFYLNCNYYQTPLDGAKMFIMTFGRWAFMICVPLFMMLTGYLKCHKTFSLKHYLSLVPVLLSYVIIAIIKVFVSNHYYGAGYYTFGSALKAIASYQIAWYVGMYVALTAIIPFLNKLFFALDKKEQQWMIVMFAIVGCLYPVTLYVIPSYWQMLYPLVYYFLGAYINTYRPRVNKGVAALILLMVTLLEAVVSYLAAGGGVFNWNVLSQIDSGYSCITVVVAACAVFLIFYDVSGKSVDHEQTVATDVSEAPDVNEGMGCKDGAAEEGHLVPRRILAEISSASLEIYLFTGIFDVIIFDYLKQSHTMASEFFWLFFLTVPINFILSTLSGIVVNRIVRLVKI